MMRGENGIPNISLQTTGKPRLLIYDERREQDPELLPATHGTLQYILISFVPVQYVRIL
jgi:hypothetical protein